MVLVVFGFWIRPGSVRKLMLDPSFKIIFLLKVPGLLRDSKSSKLPPPMAAAWTMERGKGGAGSDLVCLGVQVIGSQPALAPLVVSPQQGHLPVAQRLGWYFSARFAFVLTKFRIRAIHSSLSVSDLARMHRKNSCGVL
jgi:hypothetical protein